MIRRIETDYCIYTNAGFAHHFTGFENAHRINLKPRYKYNVIFFFLGAPQASYSELHDQTSELLGDGSFRRAMGPCGTLRVDLNM